eukprot:738459-Prymnesium_polylepis.1
MVALAVVRRHADRLVGSQVHGHVDLSGEGAGGGEVRRGWEWQEGPNASSLTEVQRGRLNGSGQRGAEEPNFAGSVAS